MTDPDADSKSTSIGATMYSLVNMHGFGRLVLLMREATASGDFEKLDRVLMEEVASLMYSHGKGKLLPISELVQLRNEERNATLGAFSRKKEKGKRGLNVLEHVDSTSGGDMIKALKLLDGGGKRGKGESKYREICWRLEERGRMGESLLVVCLMQGTTVHNLLADYLLKSFPKLVNDICTAEDYYGLTPLHLAIVNHDCEMVSKLLRKGGDVNARCYGALFCPEDQKSSRQDSVEHEYVELCLQSEFTGNMYFGEYPLSFAVCMSQTDIVRLLLTKKANINLQDTNGNTALHLCVIHEKLDMLHLCLEAGANLMIPNRQNLTPLTLAAKLAKKKFFDTILELEWEKVWSYGDSGCVAHPLNKIDTIDESSGEMSEACALALVVYGQSPKHLELLGGLLEQILEEKWKSFGRKHWYRSLIAFVFYYALLTAAFMLRPFQLRQSILLVDWFRVRESWWNRNRRCAFGMGLILGILFVPNATSCSLPVGVTVAGTVRNLFGIEMQIMVCKSTAPANGYAQNACQSLACDFEKDPDEPFNGTARLGCECFVILCILFQIFLDAMDIRRIGRSKWFSVMKTFPAKLLYKLSWILILICVPVRFSCGLSQHMLFVENSLVTAVVFLTTLHFLYFLRAIPFIGPFVLMVYSIIATDISRFFLIYSIFLVGFSQSFYMMFTTCERTSKEREAAGLPTDFDNIMQNPIDALLRTFIMTIGEFAVLYRQMAACDAVIMRHIGKVMFLLFEVCVSILQFNLLIAMMTRTYETIFLTRKEWKRQWAQVILMLEMSLSKHDRLLYLLKYSHPTGTDKDKRSYVIKRRTERSEEEELRIREEKAEKMRQERKAILRKRQRELEVKAQALRLMEKAVSRKILKRQTTVQ